MKTTPPLRTLQNKEVYVKVVFANGAAAALPRHSFWSSTKTIKKIKESQKTTMHPYLQVSFYNTESIIDYLKLVYSDTCYFDTYTLYLPLFEELIPKLRELSLSEFHEERVQIIWRELVCDRKEWIEKVSGEEEVDLSLVILGKFGSNKEFLFEKQLQIAILSCTIFMLSLHPEFRREHNLSCSNNSLDDETFAALFPVQSSLNKTSKTFTRNEEMEKEEEKERSSLMVVRHLVKACKFWIRSKQFRCMFLISVLMRLDVTTYHSRFIHSQCSVYTARRIYILYTEFDIPIPLYIKKKIRKSH